MTRSLWVTPDFPPRPGGIEQFLVNLVRRLDPTQTRVLTAPWPGDSDYDPGNPWRTDRVGRRPLLPSPRLAQMVRDAATEHGADVVVFGVAWPLAELAPHVGLPTLALTMGHEAGMVRVGLGSLIARIADRVDALGVLSHFTRRQLAPWTSGRAPVHDVFPGVDTDLFTPAADGAGVRRRYGIADDAPLVVCVSRLVPRKGQDVLIEVWPQVRRRVAGAHLLIVGTGPLRRRLQQRVHALGLRDAVTFTGAVGWEELAAHHAAGDVFAMPCRTRWGGLDVEGLGIVYLEAQACGVPVIAGRSGGAPETVLPGDTGLIVDGTCGGEVADAIVRLLQDPARRAAMGAAGRCFVRQRFAWPVVTADLHRLLGDVAALR